MLVVANIEPVFVFITTQHYEEYCACEYVCTGSRKKYSWVPVTFLVKAVEFKTDGQIWRADYK